MPDDPLLRSAGSPGAPPGEMVNLNRPLAAPPAVELVGQVLRSTYRILEVLDEGGMGRLYRAEHVRLRRPIAVKVLAHHLAHDPASLARFHREAEIVSQLHHPHIVHILDFDTTDAGAPYIVMELLQGESLARRLAREQVLPFVDVVQIVAQVSSALNLAHLQGIVHRDLKPDNVFLLKMEPGQLFVKLLDFGISKSASAAAKVTREFDVLGTPDYMAPEQAISTARAGPAADQFALASMTYEMLTGRVPFSADTVGELLHRIVHEKPPPASTYAPSLSSMVDQVLLRAMAKSPESRFASVQDFTYALAQAAGVALHSAPPPVTSSLTPQSPPVSEATNFDAPVMASLPHFDNAGPRRARSDRPAPIVQSTADERDLPIPDVPRDRTPKRDVRGSDDSGGARQPMRPKLRSHSPEEGGLGEASARPSFRPPADSVPATVRSGSGSTKRNVVECLQELRQAIAEVRRAVAFGEQQRALTQARRAVHLVRSCDAREARSALVEASSLLELVLLPTLGGLHKRVTLRNARPSEQGDWTPGHFFLLSRLEQPITVEELLDLSPLSRPETIAFLSELQVQAIVSVD